jgi:hypothetical protein
MFLKPNCKRIANLQESNIMAASFYMALCFGRGFFVGGK